jgi:hypothetical protein
MRRRCDRNGLGSIAAVLSALSAFLVMHQTQAKNASYRQSPLEAMAYDAEAAFASSMAIFDVENIVVAKLGL